MGELRRASSRRNFLRLMGAGSVATLLAACGGNSGGNNTSAPAVNSGSSDNALTADTKATISIFNFGGDADKEIYNAAYARFNKRYPNITIQDNFVPSGSWSEFTNKVTTQIAGGQAPDIINIAIEGARLLISKDLVDPLNDFIAQDPGAKELTDDVDPALTKAFEVDGKLWLMPHSWNNMVIYYNTKMFQEAGIEPPKEDWTWDDFLAIAKELTRGSGADQVYGFGIPYFNFGLVPWLLTNGTNQLDDAWTVSNLNDPKVLESYSFVYDLVHKHKVAPAVEGTDTGALFASGKVAMSGWGHWPIQGFMKNEFRDFDVQYWPRKTSGTSVHGVGGWGVCSQSKNKPIAWEIIKELCSKETIQATADIGVAIPARRSVAESPEFLKFPSNSQIFYGSLKDSKPVPSPANFTDVETIVMRHLGEAMSLSTDMESALSAAHTELSASMEKLKG
jgi:multiple sugar transport system substrate-binding protein